MTNYLIARLHDSDEIEDSIKRFLASPRDAIIYGAGTQAEVLFNLCKFYNKKVRYFLVSPGGRKAIHHTGPIPVLAISCLPGKMNKDEYDVIIGVNARHNDDIKSILREYSFKNIYYSSGWDKQNYRLNMLWFDQFFKVNGAEFRRDPSGVRYVEAKVEDGRSWRMYYPENDKVFLDNTIGPLPDTVFPSIFRNYGYMSEGPYEHGQVILRENDVVFDLGAHVGTFSTVSAAKNCFTYAFEPTPLNIGMLGRNLSLYDSARYEICPNVISDKTQKVRFYAMTDVSSGTNLQGGSLDAQKDDGIGTFDVDAFSLDDFVSERKLSRVDFIKADIEGAERLLLAGAKKTLAEFAPKLALTTYHLPDDAEVMERLILEANPKYVIEHLWVKLYAFCP